MLYDTHEACGVDIRGQYIVNWHGIDENTKEERQNIDRMYRL